MKKVKEYIKQHKDLFILKENQSEEMINEVEKKLEIEFDDSYRQYLKEFGIVLFESMETFGLGVREDSHLHVIKNTIELKENDKNFPENSVALEYIGQLNYVIYIMKKGVFQYTKKSLTLICDNLEEYLLMRFDEATQ